MKPGCVFGWALAAGLTWSISATAQEPAPLTLKECRARVFQHNLAIQAQKLGWMATDQIRRGEWGAFEPAMVASYAENRNERENTKEQRLSQNTDFFLEENREYSVGLESLLPTGARLQAGYNQRDLFNNLRIRPEDPLEHEYEGFLGVSLVQPLLRDAWFPATMARIRLAAAESDVAYQEYRKQMMIVLARAEMAYWNLVLAQDLVGLRRESVVVAEKILADNRERVNMGKMSDLEVQQAEAGVALRRTKASEADLKRVEAMNQLRTFFAETAGDAVPPLKAADRPALAAVSVKPAEDVRAAMDMHPDYLMRRRQVDQESIRLAFARTQQWPQLDLKGSAGLNGLGEDSGGAWDQVSDGTYEAWSVGIEVRIPLGGDYRARKEAAAARIRKMQALINLKAAEVELVNSIDAAAKRVNGSREQAEDYRSVADFNRKVLDTEMARLGAGKSDSRKVLDVEDDLSEAMTASAESHTRFQTARIDLDLARGTLLQSRDLEIVASAAGDAKP